MLRVFRVQRASLVEWQSDASWSRGKIHISRGRAQAGGAAERSEHLAALYTLIHSTSNPSDRTITTE